LPSSIRTIPSASESQESWSPLSCRTTITDGSARGLAGFCAGLPPIGNWEHRSLTLPRRSIL
jgi:hypothetical protein